MPKYIDVEDARKVISDYGKAALDDGRYELDTIDDIILISGAVSVIPAADVQEVVRCKDCKFCDYFCPRMDTEKEAQDVYYCTLFNRDGKPTDYCSYGARKGEDKDESGSNEHTAEMV